jgi:hypothetical protein
VDTDDWLADTRASYDTVADSYADQLREALDGKLYIRAALALFTELVHVPDRALPRVLGHFRRALRPGGALLLGFHVGDTSRLKTEGYGGHPMKVYVYRRQPAEVAAALRDAGFTVEAHMLLDPGGSLPGAILFARRQS